MRRPSCCWACSHQSSILLGTPFGDFEHPACRHVETQSHLAQPCHALSLVSRTASIGTVSVKSSRSLKQAVIGLVPFIFFVNLNAHRGIVLNLEMARPSHAESRTSQLRRGGRAGLATSIPREFIQSFNVLLRLSQSCRCLPSVPTRPVRLH